MLFLVFCIIFPILTGHNCQSMARNVVREALDKPCRESTLRNTHARTSDTLDMPTFGKSFELGDFYDAQSDKLIKSSKICTEDKLSEHTIRHQIPVPVRIVNQGRLEKRSDRLKSSGLLRLPDNIQISISAGLINTSHESDWLSDDPPREHSVRVTLFESYIFAISRIDDIKDCFLHLAFAQLSSTGTHYVDKLEYGITNIFTLEKALPPGKYAYEHITADQLTYIGALIRDGKAGNLTLGDKEFLSDVTIKAYNSSTVEGKRIDLEQLIRFYSQKDYLNHELTTPTRVTLKRIPLQNYTIPRLYQSFQPIQKFLDDLAAAEVKTVQLLLSPPSLVVKPFGNNLSALLSYLKRFGAVVRGTLKDLVLRYRQGNATDCNVESIVHALLTSPFSADLLDLWLSTMHERVILMDANLKRLQSNWKSPITDSAQGRANPFDWEGSEDSCYVTLILNILHNGKDGYLEEMKRWLQGSENKTDMSPFHLRSLLLDDRSILEQRVEQIRRKHPVDQFLSFMKQHSHYAVFVATYRVTDNRDFAELKFSSACRDTIRHGIELVQ